MPTATVLLGSLPSLRPLVGRPCPCHEVRGSQKTSKATPEARGFAAWRAFFTAKLLVRTTRSTKWHHLPLSTCFHQSEGRTNGGGANPGFPLVERGEGGRGRDENRVVHGTNPPPTVCVWCCSPSISIQPQGRRDVLGIECMAHVHLRGREYGPPQRWQKKRTNINRVSP